MSRPRLAAVVLLLVGLVVVLATMVYPPGTRGVPGPALFPRALGLALVVVAALIVRAPGTSAPAWVRYHRAVPLTMALLAAYALLWRAIPQGHGVLTAVVLLTYLRLTDLRWRDALIASVLMAVVLQVLFERGLGVRF